MGGTDTIGSDRGGLVANNTSRSRARSLVDASAFHGNVDVQGSPLGDTVIGGPGDDTFRRATRATTLSTGKRGTDTLSINITGAGAVNACAGSATSTSDGTDTIDKVERVFVYGDSPLRRTGHRRSRAR